MATMGTLSPIFRPPSRRTARCGDAAGAGRGRSARLPRVAPGRGPRPRLIAHARLGARLPSLSRTPRRHRQRHRDSVAAPKQPRTCPDRSPPKTRGASLKIRRDRRNLAARLGKAPRRGGADAARRRRLRISEALSLTGADAAPLTPLAIRRQGRARSVWPVLPVIGAAIARCVSCAIRSRAEGPLFLPKTGLESSARVRSRS